MKSLKKYLVALTAALATMAGLTGCQNDFEDHTPSFSEPVATLKPNTTIAELKEAYWKADPSYCEEVGTRPDGSHIIIAGRVTSTDKPGNVYKNLIIQDATAAITISINRNALYLDYRYGQEVVIDVTGLTIGKYSGLMQLGFPQYSNKYSQWQCTFMTYATFQEHTELNGFPRPSEVDTLTVAKFSDLPLDPNSFDVGRYQSRLVRFNNVEFKYGGTQKFCDEKSVTTNRDIIDADGQAIAVRTSGYADFYNRVLPEGRGDIVGILGYYQTSLDGSSSSPWQITLIDYEGCMNFGNPTMLPGDESNPYTVDQATEIIRAGNTATGWVTGVIVGAVYGEVTTVTSSDDIQWEAPTEMNNTLVIAPTPECKNIDECLILPLPADSKLRQYGNLRDNASNYKKQIWVTGKFDTYMGKCGVTGNSGAPDTFRIEGVTVDGAGAADGNGSQESPFNCTQIIKGTATGTDVWSTGYIVGWVDGKTLSDGARFDAAATSQTNLLIAATQGETDVTKCVPVQLPSGAVRTALNLKDNPSNFGKTVKLRGSLEKYFGANGIKSVSEFTLDGAGTPGDPDTPVTPPAGGSGTGTESDPYDVAKAFAIFNGGQTVTGWVECYIVGSIPDKIYQEANFGAANASATNIVVAASPSETNLDNCLPVQLPSGAVRSALNLKDNPSLVGKKVLLNGSIEKYFGVCGIKSVTEYKLDGASTPDTPDTPAGGLGTADAPLNVTTFIADYDAGKTGDAWVTGYIVGWVKGAVLDTGATFGITGQESASNILIAASASETDVTRCIPVQLVSGSDARAALNLKDNPGNLGRQVILNGQMDAYFKVAGLKSTASFTLK